MMSLADSTAWWPLRTSDTNRRASPGAAGVGFKLTSAIRVVESSISFMVLSRYPSCKDPNATRFLAQVSREKVPCHDPKLPAPVASNQSAAKPAARLAWTGSVTRWSAPIKG